MSSYSERAGSPDVGAADPAFTDEGLRRQRNSVITTSPPPIATAMNGAVHAVRLKPVVVGEDYTAFGMATRRTRGRHFGLGRLGDNSVRTAVAA